MRLNLLLTAASVFLNAFLFSQPYPPSAGQPGTSAIYKDSSVISVWANSCKVIRGLQDLSNPSLGYASAGDSSMATGKAMSNGAVSLGDGGSAICTFPNRIKNGPGPDFAVFENGFDDTFLELAFVEVSSDGINYFRFPAHSLTDTITQTNSFGLTDATKINNLAGKYRGGYGTPFDLNELPDTSLLNKNAVSHILVRDVVGSLQNNYASRDQFLNKINDPWPTAFPQGGFDLDAIGVIHQSFITGLQQDFFKREINIYPNPCVANSTLIIESLLPVVSVELTDLQGKNLLNSKGIGRAHV